MDFLAKALRTDNGINAGMSSIQTPLIEMTTSAAGPTGQLMRDNQYFSLRWNNYQTNITTVFHGLLETQTFVDVTLACEEHFLKAHKVGQLIRCIQSTNLSTLSDCSLRLLGVFSEDPLREPLRPSHNSAP